MAIQLLVSSAAIPWYVNADLIAPGCIVDPHFLKMRTTLEQRFKAELSDWDGFLELFHLQFLDYGEHWVRSGERRDEFFFISEGLLRTYYVDQDGTEVNEGFYDAGMLLGPISCFISGSPCLYYIQAIEPCILVAVNYHQFHRYAQDKPAILNFEITFMQSLFVSNAKRDAKRLINNGEQRYRWFCREYAHLLERIPQYHIASFLGLTPVSLSRLRRQIGNPTQKSARSPSPGKYQ